MVASFSILNLEGLSETGLLCDQAKLEGGIDGKIDEC